MQDMYFNNNFATSLVRLDTCMAHRDDSTSDMEIANLQTRRRISRLSHVKLYDKGILNTIDTQHPVVYKLLVPHSFIFLAHIRRRISRRDHEYIDRGPTDRSLFTCTQNRDRGISTKHRKLAIEYPGMRCWYRLIQKIKSSNLVDIGKFCNIFFRKWSATVNTRTFTVRYFCRFSRKSHVEVL